MSRARTAVSFAALAVTAALAGCNLVHIGSPSGGRGGAGGPTSSGKGAAADPAMVELFGKLDYNCCVEGRVRGRSILAKAGIDVTQIGHFGTPDAEWLPGWNNRGSHDELADAFVQGAINKTWSAQCLADWDDYRVKTKSLDDELRPRLGALATGAYYTRANGLRELFGAVLARRKALGVALSAEHPLSHTGLLYDVALATFALHREQKRDFAAAAVLGAHAQELELLHERGRHASADATLERDLFCAYGERFGTHRTVKLPNLGPLDADAESVPKWPAWDAAPRVEVMNKEVASKPPRAYAELPRVDLKAPWILSGGFGSAPSYDPRAPKLGRVGPMEVSSVRALPNGGTEVVLGEKKVSARGYDCRPTGRPGNDFGGQELACKTGTDEEITKITVTLGELPEGITLAKGDKLEIYLDVESDKTATPTSTGPLVVRTRTVTGNARHVSSLARGGKVIAAY